MKTLKRFFIVLLWLGVVALVGGITFLVSGFAIRDLVQQSLIQQGKVIASSINPDSVNSLIGNEKDLDNPNFQRLVEQLTNMGSVYPEIRYIYLLGNNQQNKLFFYLDSQPEKFNTGQYPELAVPGEVYEDVNPKFANIFSVNEPTIWPAAVDRWGRFVSLTLPLTNEKLNKKIVLGIDVNADYWEKRVLLVQVIPTVLTVLIVIFASLAFRSYRSSQFSQKKLNEHELMYKKIVDATRDAIVMIDANQNIVYWNLEASTIFGYEPKNAIGQNYFKLMTLDPKLIRRPTGLLNLTVKRSDEKSIIIEAAITKIQIGAEGFTIISARDVTSRSKEIEDLERMNKLMIDRELKMVELKSKLKENETV